MSGGRLRAPGWKSLLPAIADFIFPPVCQICGSTFSGDNIWICPVCSGRLREQAVPLCPLCRAEMPPVAARCRSCQQSGNLTWLYSLGEYDDGYSNLVKAIKYGPKPGLGKFLGERLAEKLRTLPHLKPFTAVCAIPLWRRKLKQRGFNQSAVLAAAVAGKLELPYYPGALIQTRAVRDQIGLSVMERFANVDGAYEADPAMAPTGKNVLIVDDVTTSGATLNAAALALKAAGAVMVAAATVAVATASGAEHGRAFAYLAARD